MDELAELRKERRAVRRALKRLDKKLCLEFAKYHRERRDGERYEPPSKEGWEEDHRNWS